jgi:hypothetical protein
MIPGAGSRLGKGSRFVPSTFSLLNHDGNRTQAIETALAMFASEGLVVAVEEGLELSIEEWKRLGFMRIAETGLVFRDQLKVNPYRDEKSV